MSWSEEVYKLGQVNRKIKVPCVVRLACSCKGEIEGEQFSKGDIIKIDKHTVIQKVVATIVDDPRSTKQGCKNKGEEIYIPLHYNGKLRAITGAKVFSSVAELNAECPKYAKVLETITVPKTCKGEGKEIKAGTIIEIGKHSYDTQGSKTSSKDRMLFSCPEGRDPFTGELPASLSVKIEVHQDDHEYTLVEIPDSYALPQTVVFNEDREKAGGKQLKVMGLEKMSALKDALNLTKLVYQELLLGHYKTMQEIEDPPKTFVRPSPIVLRVDRLADVEVELLTEGGDKIRYNSFLSQHFPRCREMMAAVVNDELPRSFCRGPAGKGPVLVRDDKPSTTPSPPPIPELTAEEEKPPLPARSADRPGPAKDKGGKKKKKEESKPKTKEVNNYIEVMKAVPLTPPPPPPGPEGYETPVSKVSTATSVPDPDAYEEPISKGSKKDADIQPYTMLDTEDEKLYDEIDFDRVSKEDVGNPKVSKEDAGSSKDKKQKKAGVFGTLGKQFGKLKIKKGEMKLAADDSPSPSLDDSASSSSPSQAERHSFPLGGQSSTEAASRRESDPLGAASSGKSNTLPYTKDKKAKQDEAVPVKDLGIKGLTARLKLCGLDALAKVCKKDKVDGKLLTSLSEEDLKDKPFCLTSLQIKQLHLMITENHITNYK